MIDFLAVTQCNTDPVFLTSVPVSTVPIPKTPAQVCALYGFTCAGSHNRTELFRFNENPILEAITMHGYFPSDEVIRKLIPRPFLILEENGHRECTMEEMYYYWRFTHQIVGKGETPVSIVEVTKLELRGKYPRLFGKPIQQLGKPTDSKALQKPSEIIFNNLGYPVKVGMRVFVHNYEIAELVPPEFQL